jgi:hypothetical protein
MPRKHPPVPGRLAGPVPAGLLLAGLLLAASGTRLPAQTAGSAPELVAVMDIEAVGASKNQAAAVSDRLREELLATHRFKLVDRSEMAKILDEQAFQQAGCTSQECAVKAGKVLGVRKLVTGRLNRVEDDLWLMSAMMVDVETAETVQAASIQHDGSFRNLLSDGVAKLALKLGQPATAVTVAAVKLQGSGAGAAGPRSAAGGTLRVVGIGPESEVFLNGLTRGSGPKQIAGLVPGSYQVEVRRKGFHTWRQTASISEGGTVDLKPETEKAKLAIFPFIRTGGRKGMGDWVARDLVKAAESEPSVELTHTMYFAGKKRQNLATDPDIAKNTWSYFGNPNTEFVAGKAKAFGVDLVLLFKIATGSGTNGTYKAYLFNINTGTVQTDSGSWIPNSKAHQEVLDKLETFLHGAVKAE